MNNQSLTSSTKSYINQKSNEPWFGCHLQMMNTYILPQKCCNYPKLTVKYAVLQTCQILCGVNWDCISFCYNNVYNFTYNRIIYHERIAKLFKNHFERHTNEPKGNWFQIIDQSVSHCDIAMKNFTLSNYYETLVTCIYHQLYLRCPQYEDFYVCSVIDEFIRNPRNCYNQAYPFHMVGFWYKMERETIEKIMKEEIDCDEYFRVLPHPKVCAHYPANLYIFQDNNKCEVQCKGNENFDVCFYSCINSIFNLTSNFTINLNNYWKLFANNFTPKKEEKDIYPKILQYSIQYCAEHFFFHLLRGRPNEEPIIVSHIIECIFQQNFLSSQHDPRNDLCSPLKSLVSNPLFCHQTDLKLLPARFWRLDRDERAKRNLKN